MGFESHSRSGSDSTAPLMRSLFCRAFHVAANALLFAIAIPSPLAQAATARDPAQISTELCVGCHGPNLAGGPAPSLIDSIWKTGSDDESILRAIREGNPQANMPPY